MIELLKKSLYATVGLAVTTREKVEDAAKKVVEEAKMSEAEGKKFVDEMIKKSEEGKAALEKLISDTIEGAMKKLNIPSRKEVNDLELRIRALESAKPHSQDER